MTGTGTWVGAVALGLWTMAMVSGCGGSGSPTSPSGGSGGGNVISGATVTIGTNGAVSPAQVTISVGQGVTFVNSDSRSHDMDSDPHPVHTDCPAMNVGQLTPGQTKVSGALTTARTCGYHDHSAPDNPSLKGTVVIR